MISLGLLYHMAAVLAAALAVHPSSTIERRAALLFKKYYDLINQGYGYHYYAKLDTTVDPSHPRRWGTPVVSLEMEFDRASGAKTLERVRLPGHGRPRPRLRYQRQLDLAYHLSADPRWAASYARHLYKRYGCSRVVVYCQEHQIPNLAQVREYASGRGTEALDLEAESTYSPRVKLGEFLCTELSKN